MCTLWNYLKLIHILLNNHILNRIKFKSDIITITILWTWQHMAHVYLHRMLCLVVWTSALTTWNLIFGPNFWRPRKSLLKKERKKRKEKETWGSTEENFFVCARKAKASLWTYCQIFYRIILHCVVLASEENLSPSLRNWITFSKLEFR